MYQNIIYAFDKKYLAPQKGKIGSETVHPSHDGPNFLPKPKTIKEH
jgi:hypothetical protein